MPGGNGARTVRVKDDESDLVASLVVSDSLAAALARAVSIPHVGRVAALSPLSLLTGMLCGSDSLGAWLRGYFESEGVDVRVLLHHQTLSINAFETLRAEEPRLALLEEPIQCTPPAKVVLSEADRIARIRDSAQPVDTRHVLAALAGLSHVDEGDLHLLGIDRNRLTRAFVSMVVTWQPIEAAFWVGWISDRVVALSESAVAPPGASSPTPIAVPPATPPLEVDDVQFTVYHPKAIQPGAWRPMLAFMHLTERPHDAAPDAPSPIERVRERAASALAGQAGGFRDNTIDARQAVPREGDITLVPSAEGIDFNPPAQTFHWVPDVHEERFELRAHAALNGQVAQVSFSAFFGVILIAQLNFTIRVENGSAQNDIEPVSGAMYRRIFPSYSHRDAEIVRQFELFAGSLGDSYLRDVTQLRAGEQWEPALRRLIREADVFQLFWSSSAMRSPQVRQEWEYALALQRKGFIRPTYWEDPLPQSPEEDLPPESLRKVHFHRFLGPATTAVPSRSEVSAGRASGRGSTGTLTLEVLGPEGDELGLARRKVFDAAGGTIGRLKSNTWTLADGHVSSRHAVIRFRNGQFLIEDTSTNGTCLNSLGTKLERGRQYPLASNDRILIDPFEIRVTIQEDARSTPGPPKPAHDQAPLDPPLLEPVSEVVDPMAALGFEPSAKPGAAPAPPAATVPPAPTTAAARAAEPSSSGLADVLRGAGVDPSLVTPELARDLGRILRIVVSGMLELLTVRWRIQEEFRLGVTTIRKQDNNPLTVSADVDDALHNLLVKRSAVYLPPVEAFEEAFGDLQNQQMAMLAGMRAAFEAMLAEFDPDRLQEDFGRQIRTGRIAGMPTQFRYWDQYREKMRAMAADPEDRFRRLFGDSFAKAYKEQLERLKP